MLESEVTCGSLLGVVKIVFQGEMEKSLGWKPLPLNDRDYSSEMPAMQVMLVMLVLLMMLSHCSVVDIVQLL